MDEQKDIINLVVIVVKIVYYNLINLVEVIVRIFLKELVLFEKEITKQMVS